MNVAKKAKSAVPKPEAEADDVLPDPRAAMQQRLAELTRQHEGNAQIAALWVIAEELRLLRVDLAERSARRSY